MMEGGEREEGERGGRERGREKLCGSMRIVPWIIFWKGVCCELILWCFIPGCFGLANFTQVLLLASEKTSL